MEILSYIHLCLIYEEGEEIQEVSPRLISQLTALLLTYCAAVVNFQPAKSAQNFDNQTQSPLTSNAICKTTFSKAKFLRLGSRGYRVCLLQIQLINWGFPLTWEGRELQVNGIFDLQTHKAVLDFQKYHGLQQDGIVGSETSKILWTPRVNALIRLLKQEDPNLRIRASSELGRMGTRIPNSLSADVYGYSGYSRVGEGDIQGQEVKAAIPHLVALLNDHNTNVRISAADSLRWISSKAVPALANPTLVELLKDKNPKVREAAVITLNFLLPDAATIAVDPVIELLKDKDTDVRKYALLLLKNGFMKTKARAAVQALGDIKAQAAVNPLIQLLDDKDANVRAIAVQALGDIKAQAAVNPLIQLLDDKDANVRAIAVQALGDIKAQAAVNPLIQLLEDEVFYVRERAAQALENIKSQAAVNPLIQLLDDKDADVRKSAVQALGDIKAQAAVNPLIQLLDDKDADVRKSAVQALGDIKAQAAVNPLIQLLDDKDAYVRAIAVQALGDIKAQAAVNPLIQLLEDEVFYVRERAAQALGNIKSQAAVNPLIQLLDDKDADVRKSAVQALENIKSQAAVNPLIQLLDDEDADVRQSAVQALGDIKAQAAVNPLIQLLDDEDADVRQSAAQALGDIKAQAAVNPLIQLLEDRDKEVSIRTNAADNFTYELHKEFSVRASAAQALGNIKSQAAADPLIKRIKDKNESWVVRINAFAALAKIGFETQALVDQLVKSFVIEALQEDNSTEFIDYTGFYTGFYTGIPAYKRHAFFFTTIESGTLPSLNKALRDILNSTDYDYKVRYSAAFILGYLDSASDSTKAPSDATIMVLKSVVNNPDEDFDIRWMSAFSLARMGQDMNQFFTKNNLINPIQIKCRDREILDPYTGWCESEEGAGGGTEGWAKIFKDMFKSRK